MADDGKGPGLLESAIIGAPVVAGVAAASKQARAGVTEIAADSLLSAMTTAGTTVPKPRVDRDLEYLRSRKDFFMKGEGAKVAQSAWRHAMAAAGPLEKQRYLSFTERLSTYGNPGEVYAAIAEHLEGNQSDITGKIFSRFKKNVDALEWHLRQTGKLPNLVTPSWEITGLSRGSLPPEKMGALWEPIERISKSLDSSVLSQSFIRNDFPGSVSTFQWRHKGMSIAFDLPISQGGTALMGRTLQTRYVSPNILAAIPTAEGFDLTPMSRQEFFLQQFETGGLLEKIKQGTMSQGEINMAIREMETSIFRELETLPNVPAGLEPTWLKAYREFRGQQIDIRIMGETGARIPTTEEYMAIMKQSGNLYGGVGATGVAKGRAQTYNLADLFPTPRYTAMGRVPQQAVRPWGYTEEALERAFGTFEVPSKYKTLTETVTGPSASLEVFDTQARKAYARAPYLTTVYVDPERYKRQLEKMGLQEGEALMSYRAKGILQQEYLEGTHLTAVDREVIEAIQAGKPVTPGAIIGRHAETGELVRAPARVEGKLIGAELFKSRSRGDFATIWQVNQHRFRQYEKWFGDLKALARFVEERMFNYGTREFLGTGVEADVVAKWDDLVKDPAKLHKQILTGLHMHGRYKTDRGTFASRFLQEPLAMAAEWEAGTESSRAFVQKAMRLALEEFKFTPTEFGDVFGAVPAAFGGKEASQIAKEVGASALARKQMFQGRAIGAAQLTWGGLLEGVGGLGSIEPRVFDILAGAPYQGAPFAKEMADDLARRVALTSPERVKAFESITKTLSSMQGLTAMPEGAAFWDPDPAVRGAYTKDAFQGWLEGGGGWLKMGADLPAVYVPGAEIQAMRPHETAAGTKLSGYLPDIYHNLAEQAGRLEAGQITKEQMQSHLRTAQADLAAHAAPGGKGIGGFLRGKVLGSRYLTAVSALEDYVPTELDEVGVSKSHLRDMFQEMKRSGLYTSDELEAIWKGYKETGRMRGMVSRHPFIGAFSMQPVWFKGIETAEDSIAVAEKKVSMRIGREKVTMNLSTMLGMAADKDADALSAFLVSPRTAKKLEKYMANAGNEYQVAYAQHQLRLQLIKAKKAAGEMTLAQIEKDLYGDVAKLGIIQKQVPFLSTEMTTARRAALQNMKGQKLANAQFLLEWLEQTPISGKHIPGSQTISFEAQMDAIRAAFSRGRSATNTETTKAAVTSLVGEVQEIVKEGSLGRRLFSESLPINMTGAERAEVKRTLGFDIGETLRGMNLTETVTDIFKSMQKFEQEGALEKARLISGTGKKLWGPQAIKQFLQTVSFSGGHAMGEAVGARGIVDNLLGSAGQSIIRHHKPIGFGIAGAIALSLALSSPNETVGSGRGMLARAKMNMSRSADRIDSGDMQTQHQMGSPSAPGMMHQNSTSIAGPPRYRTHVRARSNFTVTPSSIISQIGGVTGGGSSANLSIRDSRSSTNPHSLMDKIFG